MPACQRQAHLGKEKPSLHLRLCCELLKLARGWIVQTCCSLTGRIPQRPLTTTAFIAPRVQGGCDCNVLPASSNFAVESAPACWPHQLLDAGVRATLLEAQLGLVLWKSVRLLRAASNYPCVNENVPQHVLPRLTGRA